MRPEGVVALAIDCSLLAANSPTTGALIELLDRQAWLWFRDGPLSQALTAHSMTMTAREEILHGFEYAIDARCRKRFAAGCGYVVSVSVSV
jgi:hypothetical protein